MWVSVTSSWTIIKKEKLASTLPQLQPKTNSKNKEGWGRKILTKDFIKSRKIRRWCLSSFSNTAISNLLSTRWLLGRRRRRNRARRAAQPSPPRRRRKAGSPGGGEGGRGGGKKRERRKNQNNQKIGRQYWLLLSANFPWYLQSNEILLNLSI